MRSHRMLGFLLVALSLSVTTGIIVEYGKWWLAVDAAVILICGIGGLMLLFQRDKEGRRGRKREEEGRKKAGRGAVAAGGRGPVQMALYLLQHGEAVNENVDPNRPLTPKGKEDVAATATFLEGLNVKIDEVWHSQKLRARQTADIITQTLGVKESIEKRFLNPNDPVSPVAGVIDMHPKNILIAGHLPFLAKLAALLLTGSEKEAVVTFQQGRVACLEKSEAGWTLNKEKSNLA